MRFALIRPFKGPDQMLGPKDFRCLQFCDAAGQVVTPVFTTLEKAQQFGDIMHANGYSMDGLQIGKLFQEHDSPYDWVDPDPVAILGRIAGDIRKIEA